jgi:hypothetical protein
MVSIDQVLSLSAHCEVYLLQLYMIMRLLAGQLFLSLFSTKTDHHSITEMSLKVA